MKQKGFIQLIPLLLLIAGLIAGLYLVQTKTNLLPKAYDSMSLNITDKAGIPLPYNVSDPNVYLLIKLPYGWDVSPEEGPVTHAQEASNSSSNIIKNILIENDSFHSISTDDGISGSPPLYVTSNFKEYFNKPIPWKLKDLAPGEMEAKRTVRVTFSAPVSSDGTNNYPVSKKDQYTLQGGNYEGGFEGNYYTINFEIMLSRGSKPVNEEIEIEVIVDNHFENTDEIINWAKDTIDNYLNNKLKSFEINRKVRFLTASVDSLGGCWDNWNPPVVPKDNRIRVYITKDPGAATVFRNDISTGYSGWAQSYRNIICIGNIDGQFSDVLQEVFLHEFGHILGLPDYYNQDLFSWNNEVAPISIISSVKDVMWRNEPRFDPNSREIINRMSTSLPGSTWNWQFYGPKQVILQILNDSLTPLPNVKVEVFPAIVTYNSNSRYPVNVIPNIASFERLTDSTGLVYLGDQEYIFRHQKIFAFSGGGTALIRITSNDDVRYAALTMSDLNTLYFAQGLTNFATIKLPFSQLVKVPVPKSFPDKNSPIASPSGNVALKSIYKSSAEDIPSESIREQWDKHVYYQLKATGELDRLIRK